MSAPVSELAEALAWRRRMSWRMQTRITFCCYLWRMIGLLAKRSNLSGGAVCCLSWTPPSDVNGPDGATVSGCAVPSISFSRAR
jgi:hypothetical protein